MIFWMPQLLKSLSSQYSNTLVGLLVMIPYLVGLPVMILVSRSSDRRLERRYHAAIPLTLAAVSLVLLRSNAASSVFVSVILWCVAASGIVSVWGPFWSLPCEFLTGFSAAAGIALINSFGNLRWLCWELRDGGDQQENRELSRRATVYRGVVVHIGNADNCIAEKKSAGFGSSGYRRDQSGV